MSVEPKAKFPNQHDEGEYVLSLGYFLRVVWKRLWVIALVAFLVTVVVVGVSLLLTPRYEASVEILVGQQQGLVEDPNNAIAFQQITATLTEAVSSRPVAEEVIQSQDLEVTPEDFLEKRLTAEQISDTQFIQVGYTDTDPQRAQKVANAVGEVFSERISEVAQDDSAVSATVWATAVVPDEPVSPNPLRNGGLAFAFSLLLGLGLAFLLEYLDDSWDSPEEMERVSGVPTFGVIPRFEAPDSAASQRKKGD